MANFENFAFDNWCPSTKTLEHTREVEENDPFTNSIDSLMRTIPLPEDPTNKPRKIEFNSAALAELGMLDDDGNRVVDHIVYNVTLDGSLVLTGATEHKFNADVMKQARKLAKSSDTVSYSALYNLVLQVAENEDFTKEHWLKVTRIENANIDDLCILEKFEDEDKDTVPESSPENHVETYVDDEIMQSGVENFEPVEEQDEETNEITSFDEDTVG